jgi:hypothetical protein
MHCRLKLPGCTNPRPEGAKAFALTARKPHTNALNTQGVALGWWLLAFQAVLLYLSIFMAKVCGFAFFSYLCKQIEGILDS